MFLDAVVLVENRDLDVVRGISTGIEIGLDASTWLPSIYNTRGVLEPYWY